MQNSASFTWIVFSFFSYILVVSSCIPFLPAIFSFCLFLLLFISHSLFRHPSRNFGLQQKCEFSSLNVKILKEEFIVSLVLLILQGSPSFSVLVEKNIIMLVFLAFTLVLLCGKQLNLNFKLLIFVVFLKFCVCMT